MKRFLDSSVLVESCLKGSRFFAAADRLVNDAEACTSAHGLAECFATLSGDPRLKIRPADAAQMVEDLAEALEVRVATLEDYRTVISKASPKGVRGGMVYDALHAETARKAGCKEIHTLNVSHFKHVAPDLTVLGL
jgi:predicted nucleic acid-binding protein